MKKPAVCACFFPHDCPGAHRCSGAFLADSSVRPQKNEDDSSPVKHGVRSGEGAMTYYDVLGIPLDADEKAVRSAYRSLARRYHPDLGEGSSVERFHQVVEAYEILNDPARRRLYDLSLRRPRQRVPQVEPMIVGAEPLTPGTRKRTRASTFFEYTHPSDWNDFFDEVFRVMGDFFGPPRFRW